MAFETFHYFGFYFEISEKKTVYKNEYRCKNEHQFGTNQGYSFCPLCGSTVESIEYENGSRYLTWYEVEERLGLEEWLIGPGEVSEENKKYFGINCRLDGVREDSFNSDEVYIDLSSMDYQKDLETAMKNKDFVFMIKRLEDEFGDNFKLKYGIFTYVL